MALYNCANTGSITAASQQCSLWFVDNVFQCVTYFCKFIRLLDWVWHTHTYSHTHTHISHSSALVLVSWMYFFCSQIFKTKAVELARKMLPALNTATGIPNSLINLQKYVTHKLHIYKPQTALLCCMIEPVLAQLYSAIILSKYVITTNCTHDSDVYNSTLPFSSVNHLKYPIWVQVLLNVYSVFSKQNGSELDMLTTLTVWMCCVWMLSSSSECVN